MQIYNYHIKKRNYMVEYLLNKVEGVVSDFTSIPVSEIRGRSKNEEIVDARHMAIYILHAKLNISRYYIKREFKITYPAITYIIYTFIDRIREKPYLRLAYNKTIQELKNFDIIK